MALLSNLKRQAEESLNRTEVSKNTSNSALLLQLELVRESIKSSMSELEDMAKDNKQAALFLSKVNEMDLLSSKGFESDIKSGKSISSGQQQDLMRTILELSKPLEDMNYNLNVDLAEMSNSVKDLLSNENVSQDLQKSAIRQFATFARDSGLQSEELTRIAELSEESNNLTASSKGELEDLLSISMQQLEASKDLESTFKKQISDLKPAEGGLDTDTLLDRTQGRGLAERGREAVSKFSGLTGVTGKDLLTGLMVKAGVRPIFADAISGFAGTIVGGIASALGLVFQGVFLKKAITGSLSKSVKSGGILKSFSGFGKLLLSPFKAIIKSVSSFGSSKPMKAVIKFFSKGGIFKILKPLLTGMKVISKAFLPIGLMIDGIVGLFQGFTNFEEITGDKDAGFLKKIGASVAATVESFTFGLVDAKDVFEFLSSGIESVMDWFSSIGTKVNDFIKEKTGIDIGSRIDSLYESIMKPIKAILDLLPSLDSIKNKFAGWWNKSSLGKIFTIDTTAPKDTGSSGGSISGEGSSGGYSTAAASPGSMMGAGSGGPSDVESMEGAIGPSNMLKGLKPGVVKKLKVLQKKWGKPLVITSGFRTPSQNEAAGGAKDSQHLVGKAVDIRVPPKDQEKFARLARASGFGGIGIGRGQGFVHVDDRGRAAQWGYQGKGDSGGVDLSGIGSDVSTDELIPSPGAYVAAKQGGGAQDASLSVGSDVEPFSKLTPQQIASMSPAEIKKSKEMDSKVLASKANISSESFDVSSLKTQEGFSKFMESISAALGNSNNAIAQAIKETMSVGGKDEKGIPKGQSIQNNMDLSMINSGQ